MKKLKVIQQLFQHRKLEELTAGKVTLTGKTVKITNG